LQFPSRQRAIDFKESGTMLPLSLGTFLFLRGLDISKKEAIKLGGEFNKYSRHKRRYCCAYIFNEVS